MPLKSARMYLLALPVLLALGFAPSPSAAAEWVYTVVEGDNLWDFSEKHLDSVLRFEQIRKLNNVAFPRRMRPGTRLRVPMQWIRSNPIPATVDAVIGEIHLWRADSDARTAASAGDQVWLGDRLASGPDSSAAVRFADGSILTLHSASEMRFDHLSAHGETGMVDSQLRLIKGRVDTHVKPAVGPGSRFEIKTPSAISAVRGTAYRAAVTAGEQASNIEVIEGRVRVTGKRKPRLVRAGFGTRVEIDRPPLPPQRLLPAPELDPLPATVRQLNWPLAWPAIDQATAYRIEIRSDRNPDLPVWDRMVTSPRAALPDLDDGVYQLNVRGIGRYQLEGNDAVMAVVIDTDPQPPVLLQPGEGQVHREEAAELRWTASADAQRYLLEIASDPDFANVLLRKPDLTGTAYRVDELTDPSTYHWRVTSIAPDGELGPPGVSRTWQLKEIPEAVEAELSAVDDDTLTASWRNAGPNQRYQAQVANDSQFTDLEIDRVSAETSLSIAQSTRQVRYLRVRTIEPDGYLGPWGAVQRIDPPPDSTVWFFPAITLLAILLL